MHQIDNDRWKCERGQQGVGFVGVGLDHDPAAEVVRLGEMGVVGGDGGQAAALGQQQIVDRPAVRPVAALGAAVVINLDRVRGLDAARIGQGQASIVQKQTDLSNRPVVGPVGISKI